MDDQSIVRTVQDAVTSCEGVARLTSPLGIAGRSIKLSKSAAGLGLDVYIKVVYGENIPRLSWTVQTRIREALESSKQKLSGINIHVQGVER